MESLSQVSQTALITLRARVIESEASQPVLDDPMGRFLLNRLAPILPDKIQRSVMAKKPSPTLTRHLALRARKYDAYVSDFLIQRENGLVVSLGSGFDTRYWRVSDAPWRYIEVDLPSVVDIKTKVLGEQISYPMIGATVLDPTWIDQVGAMQTSDVLFLAEGLLMYLNRSDVIQLFQRLSSAFTNAQFVFEVVNERYTRGFWKKRVESKMRRSLGSEAGVSYNFGVRSAQDVEQFGKKIRVFDEWSYLEEKEVYPRMMHRFRNVSLFSRAQWTVATSIG